MSDEEIIDLNETPTKPNRTPLEVIQDLDTEKIGKHARTIRDRTQLFVMDHKVECIAGLFFVAGVWVGRRSARKALRVAAEAVAEATMAVDNASDKMNHLTFFEMFGFEPDGRHVIIPPIEWNKIDKMSKKGKLISYEVGSHVVDIASKRVAD